MRYVLLQFLILIELSELIPDSSGEVDLKDANVTDVTFSKLGDQEYKFAVALYHDDDGEDGYADKWQIEELNGSILGTRILTHPHGTVEFTRSHTLSVPDDVNTVIIRGHDQTHGYGGQVIIVSLLNGSNVSINQGSDHLNFSSFIFQEYVNVSNFNSGIIYDIPSSTYDNVGDSDNNRLDFNFKLSGILLFFSVPIIKYKSRSTSDK